MVTTPISYSLDANGSMTSDGLRSFDYDEADRLAKVRILQGGEAASVSYLTNGLGQRVFKGEPVAEQTLPDEETLGVDFIAWLKSKFRWMFENAQATASVGTSYVYAEGLPPWALLGEYDNGSASGTGRTEYIWLPSPDGNAIPIAMYRNGQFYTIHTDHLGTPRLVKDNTNTPVWQWPYSAFGNNRPVGVLSATSTSSYAITAGATPLRATAPAAQLNLRHPGQYADSETGEFYNYFRNYDPRTGRYTQSDPIGLDGGWSRFGYVGGNPLRRTDPLGLAEYEGLPIIEGHLRWLATMQGDSFMKSPFWAAEREMVNRLKRGEESNWDVAFYHHEMAEAGQCRPFLTSPVDEALRRQKEAHDQVLRDQQNREQDLYHPDVVNKHRDLFSPKWFGKN